MELTFNKEGSIYVSEFQVDSDFNLHLEKGVGFVKAYQRTAGDKFALIKDFGNHNGDHVIDVDIVGTVYPKYMKIECEVNPTVAQVTFE